MKQSSALSFGRAASRLGAIGSLAVCAAFTLATPSSAQTTGADLWAIGNCAACHGLLAEGGAGGDMPAGPSIRRTRLTPGQLTETISCGRPGTGMPYHLQGAYTQSACYGLPVGPAPAEVLRGASFNAEQIKSMIEFLQTSVIGQTRVTKKGCAAFFGGDENAPACRQIP